jgi:hypothetical protein
MRVGLPAVKVGDYLVKVVFSSTINTAKLAHLGKWTIQLCPSHAPYLPSSLLYRVHKDFPAERSALNTLNTFKMMKPC